MLVTALEGSARTLGMEKTTLGVELSNPRARALYEKLGYAYFKTATDSWEAADPDGNTYTHQTQVAWLSKSLEQTR